MDQKTNRTNEINKNTALRLCNKYAEEYKSLDLQLNSYKKENNDLRTNIQVQKEIINSFFSSQPFETKSKIIFSKQKEEIELLTNQLCEMAKRITKEREYYSSMKNKIELSFSVVEKENERIKNENFILENLLQEKVSLIEKMRRNFRINSNNSKIEIKETYITNPKTIINSLNNELCFYKEKNQSLMKEIEKMKKDISIRDKSIKQLERIITKYNINGNTVTYDKPSNPKLDDITTTTNNKLSKSESNIFIKQLESFEEINRLKTKEYDYKKEWIDILKSCSVSANEYLSYSSNPQMKKICDIIEYLFKTLIEKNRQLSLVFKENESLNQANIKINKRNIELTTKLGEFAFNNIHSSKSVNSTIVPSYNNDSYIKSSSNALYDKFNNTNESVTSSEFNNGIVLDLFELESEMSTKNNTKVNYNTKSKSSEVSSNNEDSVHIKI